MTLADLNTHEKGIIKNLPVAEIPIKLFEMGCLLGDKITIMRKLPFNGPLHVKVGDTYLVLRWSTAKLIEIVPYENG